MRNKFLEIFEIEEDMGKKTDFFNYLDFSTTKHDFLIIAAHFCC